MHTLNGVLLIRRLGARRRPVDAHGLVGHKTRTFEQAQHKQNPPDKLEHRVGHVQGGVVCEDRAAGVADSDVGGDEVRHEGQAPDPSGHLGVTAADKQIAQDTALIDCKTQS